jgi:hypothetical protein
MVPGDIPLKSLAHYAPLEDDHSTRNSMSAARATASPNRSHIFKRGSRYTEIPDDQEHLLADPPVGEDYGDHDSEILMFSRDALKGANRRMVRNIMTSLCINNIHQRLCRRITLGSSRPIHPQLGTDPGQYHFDP